MTITTLAGESISLASLAQRRLELRFNPFQLFPFVPYWPRRLIGASSNVPGLDLLAGGPE
jgi:hypothetical protein